MSEENTHWTSKVKVFIDIPVGKIEETLNKFYENTFIIATQVLECPEHSTAVYNLIVYFKTPPKDKAEQ